jgi:hypothetical protein
MPVRRGGGGAGDSGGVQQNAASADAGAVSASAEGGPRGRAGRGEVVVALGVRRRCAALINGGGSSGIVPGLRTIIFRAHTIGVTVYKKQAPETRISCVYATIPAKCSA